MRTLRVAFLISALRGGGAERATATLASGLDAAAFDVSLILERHQEQLYEIAPSLPVSVLGVSSTRRALRPLVSVLRRDRPDIVYAALPHLNALAAAAVRFVVPKPRLVVSVHNNHEREWVHMQDGQRLKHLTPWAYRSADAVVTVSQGLAAQVQRTRGVAKEKVHCIYNPIDADTIERVAMDEVNHEWLDETHDVVVAMGRLAPQKDYGSLLRAFAVIREARSRARLMVLGDGEQRRQLEQLSCDLGVADSVSFLGVRANPFAYIARADCFVLTSSYEGFGMAIVEAMTAGTPVVSTDCPYGPAEILGDGRWGLLARAGSIESIAACVLRVLNDGALGSTLRSAGRQRARDFRADVIVPQLAKLFLDLSRPDD